MKNKNLNCKNMAKKFLVATLACVTVISSAMMVYADSKSKTASTCLGSNGTMSTSIRVGDELVQGSISTDVISDMSIKGSYTYTDLYSSNVTRSISASREQDYSCVAFVSKSNTLFTEADMDYTAYDNDGVRAYQELYINFYK